MRIGVVTVQVPFVEGGAEHHARNLVSALVRRGHIADLITIPFKWYPAQKIIDSMAMARMLDLTEANGVSIDLLIGLKFPAYLAPHPDKVLWILHQHRQAYELWAHPQYGDLITCPEGQAVRDAIRYADSQFIGEAHSIYANSENIANRLKRYNGIEAEPLYHPPNEAEAFYSADALDYLFFPSRITEIKRQALVIEALAHCHFPVRVVFAGVFESASNYARMQKRVAELNLVGRVVWEGLIPEDRKRRLYAECLGVVFPPLDEDYGYITLEAMLAKKPVLTTTDSGGPLEFVVDGETGLIVAPQPQALAEAMDMLWQDRIQAAKMGRAGHARYCDMGISWDNVVDVLTT